jgi:hypothetical protein
MKHFVIIYNSTTGYVERFNEFDDLDVACRSASVMESTFTDDKYDINIITDDSLDSVKMHYNRWRFGGDDSETNS